MILKKTNYISFRIQQRIGIVLSIVFLLGFGYNVYNLFRDNQEIYFSGVLFRTIFPLACLLLSVLSIFKNKPGFKLIQVLLIYAIGILAVIFSDLLSLHGIIYIIFSLLLAIQFGFFFRYHKTKLVLFFLPFMAAVGVNSYINNGNIISDIIIMSIITAASIYLFWTIFSDEIDHLTDEKKLLKSEMEKNQVFVKFGINVAGMIHNLKSILHSVFGFQEIIGETTDMKQIREYLDLQKIASDALFDQIQNLLQTVKLYQQPERTGIDLSRMVELTLEVMNCQMDFKHNIKVDNQCSRTMIYAAPIEIMQLLDNILKNSWEAVRQKKEKNITIRCIEADNYVKLIISDSGGGIPWFIGKGRIDILQSKEIQPGKTTKEKGTGIGLLYSQNLMKELNGAFYLTSTREGTEIELHFKIAEISADTVKNRIKHAVK